ncbi:hypothetical protein CKM354_000007700 [Cercospora kikuchii]|uniref:Early meiotic induction protein 1 n=1 Tax=Cercospora kikuchii TaxID=84275 RepID=A0A9P3C897_9PEZI|nr:uncharacterized protein CKM354_000007700 [Cercospora kikuchii]GIZ36607.1 hypothetical protein CKM354_000007700 [Cercospora kikuchii]
MGWLWSSSTGDAAKQPSPTEAQPPSSNDNASSIALTEEQRLRIFGRPSPTPSSSSTTQPTREQAADAELDALIKEFSSSDPTNPTKALSALTKVEQQDQQQTERTALPAQTYHEPPPTSRLLPDGSLDISPSAILPRTMSCRQQFDQAFYCQSLGGKFNDIYRYGHLRACSEQWGAFWFCMRTRTLPDKEKEEAIVQFYQERDEKRKKERGGSSEDVWELRTRAVERAFWRDPDEDVEGSQQGMVKSGRE